MLVVANGTEHLARKLLPGLDLKGGTLRAIALNKRVPQAVCLKAAFKESRGDVVVVTGSYPQITKGSFYKLLAELDEETDVVSPWRENRVDPAVNQAQSRLFNYVVRKITGTRFRDLSCTVKVIRREVLEQTELYGNMYRYLPIFAEQKGFRIKEVACDHQKEYGKVGFFGFPIYFTRVIDLLTLYFNTHFSRKPLRFFSGFGLLFFMIGFTVFGYVFVQRLVWGIPIGGRAVLLLAILFIILGVQFSSVGLLGEIIAFTYGRYRKEYTIAKII
jgi:hypothetical protein